MFDEVIKFGANIVDSLLEYKQPIFVYIPPYSEVRGGAWVVIDSQINSDFIEMYASESARGGVLEPNAIVEFKYRKEMMIKTMRRLDPILRKLVKKEQAPDVMLQIERRQHLLHGMYKQIAIKFADLHDCPERLLAKNTIREIVPWKKSRSYFYWRLRYRLHLQKIYLQIQNVSFKHLTQKIEDLIKDEMKVTMVTDW